MKAKNEPREVHVENPILTFTYSMAVVSLLLATVGVVTVMARLFTLWTGSSAFGIGYQLLWFFSGAYVSTVSVVLVTVLFSVLAFLLYRRASAMIRDSLDYLNTKSYNFVTNALVAVYVIAGVILLAETLSVLFSSLLFIGSGVNIGSLYLGQFLPDFVGLMIVAAIGYMAYKIMRGKNMSFAMTLSMLIMSGLLFIAVFITIPVKVHQGIDSVRTYEQYQYQTRQNPFNN